MKNSNIIKHLTVALVLLLTGSFLLTGCSNDDAASTPKVKEGIVFKFKRKLVYATGVDQIGSVKITIFDVEKKKMTELPSSLVTGDEELSQTVAFALPVGDYQLVSYKAYNKRQDPLFEIELDSQNEFKVETNTVSAFIVPVKMRSAIDQSPIRNTLLGVCEAVFGKDQTTWPWDPEKYPYPDWEGLEFEFDDYGNPMYIAAISFNGLKDGKETPWVQMTAIPDGTISNMGTLIGITINDIPNFKSLPSDLDEMPELGVIMVNNSGLEELPANLSSLTVLNSLVVNNCQLKVAPAGISALTDLRVLHMIGNQLSIWDVPMTKLTKLESVNLSNNPLNSIAEGTFAANGSLAELKLNNTNLSALPAEIGRMTSLRGIYLDGNKFSSIPAQVKSSTGIKAIYIGGNPLTLAANDFTNLSELEILSVVGAKMTSLPKLSIPTLRMLDIADCGLTSAPDLSALPNLRSLYMGGNELTTLPSNYFAANPLLRTFSLANSAKLTSMPAGNLGLVSKISATKEGFKWINVENCPALTWVTPVDWQCFDAQNDPYNPKTRRPEIPEGGIRDEFFGRVMVTRKGSSNVTFGK